MFEEYLLNSNYFRNIALKQSVNKEAKKYYRVSIFCAMSAIEAFVNSISEGFKLSSTLEVHEIHYLLDQTLTMSNGVFKERIENHGIDEKLKFLLKKFSPSYEIDKEPSWVWFMEFRKIRNNLIHPKSDDDEITVEQYKEIIKKGLNSIIDIINVLCNGLYKKPLRKKITDLKE